MWLLLLNQTLSLFAQGYQFSGLGARPNSLWTFSDFFLHLRLLCLELFTLTKVSLSAKGRNAAWFNSPFRLNITEWAQQVFQLHPSSEWIIDSLLMQQSLRQKAKLMDWKLTAAGKINHTWGFDPFFVYFLVTFSICLAFVCFFNLVVPCLLYHWSLFSS